MRITKILAILLACCMLLPALAACGGKPEDTGKPDSSVSPDKPVPPEENWADKVDFDGDTLNINVSVYFNDEQTFRPADIFSRGPDSLSEDSDAVEKMIFNRNKTVTDKLNLKVKWQEMDLEGIKIQQEIQRIVKADEADTPDIFINDVYDEVHCIVTGTLWNLLDPQDGQGNPIKSYFNFNHPAWAKEYMEGTTVDKSKIYIAAGDYFIDMLRYAFVMYMNRDMYNENFTDIYGDSSGFYQQVLAGEWDYDTLRFMIETVFRDGSGGVESKADPTDDAIGLITNTLFVRTCVYSSGLSVFEWENGEKYCGKATFKKTFPEMQALSEKYSKLYNTAGVYQTAVPVEATTLFLTGNTLFTLSLLGELESEQVRDSAVSKGIIPVPKYDMTAQKDYFTLVHDQAEVACIPQNARNFTAASAFLQLNQELSTPIVKEYYEKSLKLKYNDDKDTKQMIDLIHDRMVEPFEFTVARMVVAGSFLPGCAPGDYMDIFRIIDADAKEEKSSFVSEYEKNLPPWEYNMELLLGIFRDLQ